MLRTVEPEGTISVKMRPARTTWSRILVRVGIGIVALAVLVYVGICGYAAEKLSKPERRALGDPASYGLPLQDVEFKSAEDGVPLSGWFADSPGSKTILMLHGRNGARDDDSIGMMEIAKSLVGSGYDVFMFDFRAHGMSGGERYSFGQWEVRDVAGAIEYLKSRGVTEVGVLGFSMGAATALNAAPDQPEIKALVLDSAFADLNPVLDAQLSKASGLPGFFNPGILFMEWAMYGINLWDNDPEKEMPSLNDRPMLLIHSTVDGRIPVDHAYRLEKAGAGNPNLQLWVATATGHVQSFKDNRAEYLKRLTTFFNENLK